MVLQLIHLVATPVVCSLAYSRGFAVMMAFSSIFVLWCIHFNALDLEFPFGSRVNDLPMHDMQRDWNMSICTLLQERASRPPVFTFSAEEHRELTMAMSDAS